MPCEHLRDRAVGEVLAVLGEVIERMAGQVQAEALALAFEALALAPLAHRREHVVELIVCARRRRTAPSVPPLWRAPNAPPLAARSAMPFISVARFAPSESSAPELARALRAHGD